ncbi:MAG: clostripain-related cysteine peptidase, partial [Aggregatilineales bacterium]
MFKIRRYYLHCIIFILLFSISGAGISQESASSETLSGVIEGGDNYFQEFDLEIIESSTVTLDMNPSEDSELDTFVKLIDRNNLVIAENDDVNTDGGDYTSFLTVKHLQPGDYRIVATRFDEADGETTGAFDIAVTIAPIDTPEAYVIDDADLDNNGFPALEPHDRADWTILAYYGADTNLEKDVMNDFNEFELAGGSDENVRIIALMDRTPAHSTASGDWTDARLFEITADTSGDEGNYPASAPTIDSISLKDLGEIDTGEGETLARFLVWGVTAFPADHYAVAFSSHGAAWKGIISDETDDYDNLTIPELKLALQQGVDAAGVEHFDLLINDACLMSSVEYYAEMANFFKESLGSPEIVVSPALNMTILAETLKADPDTDLNSLGRELIDTYINEDSI